MTGSNSSSDALRQTIVLAGTASEFPRLVGFAEDFARRCGLPQGERARLLIILEELFTNTVRYGYPADAPRGRVEVALAARPGQIEIDFSDDGLAFDPLSYRPDKNRGAGELAPGGHGLEIVRGLVDRARYRREGGRNRLALMRRLPDES